jgi:hypothetical protein
MAEEKKDFSRKGGYQGGFGITAIRVTTPSTSSLERNLLGNIGKSYK